MTGLPLVLYDNRFADGALSDFGATAPGDYALANLVDWRPYTWWRPSGLPARIVVDCGVARPADFVAVYGHTLGSSGNTLYQQGADDAAFSTNLITPAYITPTDDRPFVLTFPAASRRYWSILISGGTPSPLAIVAAGQRLTLPRRLRAGFDPIGRTPQGKFNRSMKGHPLGSVTDYEEWAEQLRVRNVQWDWLRNTWQPAWDAHLKNRPWLFAWDPTDHPSELYLVDSSRGYQAPIGNGPFADLELQVRGVAL